MKRHKKTGRRFVAHVKRLHGLKIEVPQELQPHGKGPAPDSVARLTCPLCGATRYINQAFLDHMVELKQAIVAGIEPGPERDQAEAAMMAPGHKPCKTIMHLEMLEEIS